MRLHHNSAPAAPQLHDWSCPDGVQHEYEDEWTGTPALFFRKTTFGFSSVGTDFAIVNRT